MDNASPINAASALFILIYYLTAYLITLLNYHAKVHLFFELCNSIRQTKLKNTKNAYFTCVCAKKVVLLHTPNNIIF